MDENLVRESDARGVVWRLLPSLAVSIINMLIQSNIINRVNIFSLLSELPSVPADHPNISSTELGMWETRITSTQKLKSGE